MKIFKLNFLLATLILLASCAKVYYSPEAEKASRMHKIIGVASPKVSIPPQKKVSVEDMKALTIAESETFHQEMISWLLKRKSQNKIGVDVLDATTTSANLANIKSENNMLTPAEIATALNVDAVLFSTYKLSKPMSAGAAIATSLLLGFSGATNQVVVNMELYDAKSKKMIWNFAHTVSGSIGSSSDRLVEEVMRIASKKLPYTKFMNEKSKK